MKRHHLLIAGLLLLGLASCGGGVETVAGRLLLPPLRRPLHLRLPFHRLPLLLRRPRVLRHPWQWSATAPSSRWISSAILPANKRSPCCATRSPVTTATTRTTRRDDSGHQHSRRNGGVRRRADSMEQWRDRHVLRRPHLAVGFQLRHHARQLRDSRRPTTMSVRRDSRSAPTFIDPS